MTEEIFKNWSLDVNKEMQKEKKYASLIIDSFAPHNNLPSLKNIKVLCNGYIQNNDHFE